MSHELSSTPRRIWRVVCLQVVAILLLCAALGAVAGWLWHQWWTPSTGIVWDHQWNKGLVSLNQQTMSQSWSENAYQDAFSATAIFAVLTGAAGLLAGLVSVFVLAASEIATLIALTLGGLGGGLIARVVGFHLSAADPTVLAQHAANGTVLPSRIQWSGPGLLVVYPGVALVVLLIVFLGVEPRRQRARFDVSILPGQSGSAAG